MTDETSPRSFGNCGGGGYTRVITFPAFLPTGCPSALSQYRISLFSLSPLAHFGRILSALLYFKGEVISQPNPFYRFPFSRLPRFIRPPRCSLPRVDGITLAKEPFNITTTITTITSNGEYFLTNVFIVNDSCTNDALYFVLLNNILLSSTSRVIYCTRQVQCVCVCVRVVCTCIHLNFSTVDVFCRLF